MTQTDFTCPYCNLDTAGNHEWNCPNKLKLWGMFERIKVDEEDIKRFKMEKL